MLVVCAGIGYRLAVSAQTLSAVPPVGREATLHTHLIVRDDALQLYGFASEDERELFLMLLGVQSVGPKVALAVLGGGTVAELYSAIAVGDSARFQTVPGVGKRTAERIIVELREKVGEALADGIVVRRSADDGPRAIAREGLIELGFAPAEAEGLLAEASGESAEELLAGALRATRQRLVR
ncbi:MAG TPA: Holliday junction branch migration protein RuvA [Solirubrobacteraceae bacterium]|nr:Holliday junction branch migration protein RuvA [Solirubrobacteraceae bacterium]